MSTLISVVLCLLVLQFNIKVCLAKKDDGGKGKGAVVGQKFSWFANIFPFLKTGGQKTETPLTNDVTNHLGTRNVTLTPEEKEKIKRREIVINNLMVTIFSGMYLIAQVGIIVTLKMLEEKLEETRILFDQIARLLTAQSINERMMEGVRQERNWIRQAQRLIQDQIQNGTRRSLSAPVVSDRTRRVLVARSLSAASSVTA